MTRRGRNFPQTDFHFQAPAAQELGRTSSLSAVERVEALRSFRQISAQFLGRESNRSYIREAITFALISAVAAWPILSMLRQMARLMRLIH